MTLGVRNVRALMPALVVLVGSGSACSSGEGSGGGSCGSAPAEGSGWNLGRPPLDPSASLRAAVFMGSCFPDDNPNTTLQDYYAKRSDDSAGRLDTVACLAAKANGCQAVTDCVGIHVTIQASCSPPVACDGNRMQVCSDGMKFDVDCTNSAMQRVCAETGCSPCGGGELPCDRATFVGHCEAGRPIRCRNGHATPGMRCADVGLECRPDPFGNPLGGTQYNCYGAGASCPTTTAMAAPGLLTGTGCSGTRLEACVGGYSHGVECAEVGAGFTCQSFASTSGETSYFCGLAGECDAAAQGLIDPTCDGDSVVLCNAGRIEKVDCTALGFTGCAPQWGRCVPGPYSEI
jgi:hypothetical protein